MNELAKELQIKMSEKGLTLGSIESFTGGSFAATITSVPGASRFYKGALVTYATSEKINLLGLSEEKVNTYGVVSKEIAYDMALFGERKLDVDYCVSFTGNAGPDAMEGKPVGEVYIGIAYHGEVSVYPYNLKGSREEIQKEAINIALECLLKQI
ncbi:MAG: CinA family protein [Coprobacillus sp.]|nr:CinA family protein [Coprobacillus sp.]